MKNLSLSEQYALCVLNEKESRSVLYSREFGTCIIAMSLWQLITCNAIKIDENKKLQVNEEFNSTKRYLKYIYDDIAQNEFRSVNEFVESYIFNISRSNLKNVIDGLVEELIGYGCIRIEKENKLLKKKAVYIGEEKDINDIMKMIREDILEEKNINAETIILVALLFWSKVYKEYFSKYEAKQLKVKIEKIKKIEEYLFIKEVLDDIQCILLSMVVYSKSMG